MNYMEGGPGGGAQAIESTMPLDELSLVAETAETEGVLDDVAYNKGFLNSN